MATKRHKKVDPWICDECGFWQFSLPHLHVAMCSVYRSFPAIGESNNRYYESLKDQKPSSDPWHKPEKKTRRKRKT